MKPLTLLCYALFLAGVAMYLTQLWFHPWNADTLVKLLITDAGFFAIAFVWAFLVRENKESSKIDKGNSLD